MEPKTIETNADQAFAHESGSKKRVINIQPITRIEGMPASPSSWTTRATWPTAG